MSTYSYLSSSAPSVVEPLTPPSSPNAQHAIPHELSDEKQSSIHEWSNQVRQVQVQVHNPEPAHGYRLPACVLTGLDTILEEEPIRASPELTRLNPGAPMFRPRGNAQPLPSLPVNPIQPSYSLPPITQFPRHPVEAPWTKHLVQGTWRRTNDSSGLANDAAALIAHPAFKLIEDTPVLVQRICERAAYLKFQGGPETIAPFIREVWDTIKRIMGVHAAENFRSALAGSVTMTFVHIWKVKIPNAKAQADPMAIELAIAGVSLGTFIGELHYLDLLDGIWVSRCVSLLLKEISGGTMEHLQALNTILMTVKADYWDVERHHVEEFLQRFLAKTALVHEGSTLGNGNGYPASVKRMWIDGVKERILAILTFRMRSDPHRGSLP